MSESCCNSCANGGTCEEVSKAKYLKREGGPGNYKYTYANETSNRSKVPEGSLQIKLTPAQHAALEARGLEEGFDLDADEQALADAWQGNKLVFPADKADAIHSALVDASNAEDGAAQELGGELAKFARNASRSLGNLSTKVLRQGAEEKERETQSGKLTFKSDEHTDKISGGVADKKSPEDFDADVLADGTAHELEHTKDQHVAMEIAMDHLTEDKDYYKKLSKIEKAQGVNWRIRKNFKVVRKVKFQGLDISIEHDKGMVRHWKEDSTGEEGKTKMHYPYGYICRTDGADGEQVDVYVGPEPDEEKVYIVHQMKRPNYKRYDEDKVMVGFSSSREAKSAYLMHFDDPRFFGSMTTTTIADFKRMFVNKSISGTMDLGRTDFTRYEMDVFKAHWSALCKAHDNPDLQKGILDQLKKLWGKVRDMFGGKDSASKPKKKWIRNTEQHCRTGVCIRLNGQEIDIDDQFKAMNGMMVDGPPAHKECKCTLEFYDETAKAMPPMGDQPMMPQANPMAPNQMMMPMLDPHDMETFEGVGRMLNNLGASKEPELMEIASKIWGPGYNFEGHAPDQARSEILGFLLDQRDLLGVEPAAPIMPDLQPSPSLPVKEPNGSSDYFGPSPTYRSESVDPAHAENSYEGESQPEPLINSPEQDSSPRQKSVLSAGTESQNPLTRKA